MKHRNRLRVLRAEKDITQRDLALKVKISPQRMWEMENGYVAPRDDEPARLAKFFGCAVSDIWPDTKAIAS